MSQHPHHVSFLLITTVVGALAITGCTGIVGPNDYAPVDSGTSHVDDTDTIILAHG